jgi:hypothetical protein
MEELTKVLVSLNKDENYRLNIFLAKIRKVRMKNEKTTKADELVRLAMIGIIHESKNL